MSKITFPPAGRAAGALLPGGPERGWRTHLYWYVDAALAPDDMALRARYGAWWCEGWRTAEEYWERMFAKFFSTGSGCSPPKVGSCSARSAITCLAGMNFSRYPAAAPCI